jgi:uncharacterized protein YbaP (TraB family)
MSDALPPARIDLRTTFAAYPASAMHLLFCFLARLFSGRTALAGVFAALLPLAAAQGAEVGTACPPPPQQLTSESLNAGIRSAKDHGFLWRMTKDGRSSYLYGTIHAAKAEWMVPGPLTLDALQQSDTLALELDVLDPDIQRRLAASIGSQKKEPLPPALVKRIERQMKAQCADAEIFARFAPEFQVATLSVMAARRDGLDPAHAIDLVLAVLARQFGKPVASLETPEMQVQALQMPSQAETIDFVSSSLDDLESGRTRPMLNHIAKVWIDGNFAELARFESWCNCVDTATERAAMKRMLDDRNPQLAAAIDILHSSGTRVFAAVGSLHMIGPRGLPALLRQRGYRVEQSDFAR